MNKRQLLLERLDRTVWAVINRKPRCFAELDVRRVLLALTRIQAGQSSGNTWALEDSVFTSSRLIQKWHYMSMDLSI